MNGKNRLELTWIGKDERPRLEPRILIEDPAKSHHASMRGKADIFENTLIRGDNLLALKALQATHAGKIKCIYIDPPFNTHQALEHYDDGVEHSLWLSLMRDRLEGLHSLLSNDGTIFIHIDDNELAYLTVIADEIFGRANRCFIITFKQASATGHKAINPGCVSVTNYVLIYAKDKASWKPNRIFTGRERDKRYNQYIPNVEDHHSRWRMQTLMAGFADRNGISAKEARDRVKASPEELDGFVLQNPEHVIRLAVPSYDDVGKETQVAIDRSKREPDTVVHVPRDGFSDIYLKGGQRLLFYRDKLKIIDGEPIAGEPLTTLWDDILSNNLHAEGGIDFPKGKKPEGLIKRCLDLATKPGDWVLDSFAGSGTTGAVAHKMRRRWVMVEMGEQAETHILPRLKSVVNGTDASGVSSAVQWSGGGGFRYCHLAPSLIETDRWGNAIISKKYNPAMLAEAMCKHMGFTYAPSTEAREYWKHGSSSERDFIYVTTASLTTAALRRLSADVGPEQTLLVCCKAFEAKPNAFDNLTLKKIPQVVLANCEWGRDDYSLRISQLPEREDEEVEPVETAAKRGKAKAKPISNTPSLFDVDR